MELSKTSFLMVPDLSVAPFQIEADMPKFLIDLVVCDYLFFLISSKHVGSNDKSSFLFRSFFESSYFAKYLIKTDHLFELNRLKSV